MGGGEIGTFWHVPRMVLSWSMHADVGMLGCRVAAVGCPKTGRKPFRGLLREDRVRVQHCSHDAQVRAQGGVDPCNLTRLLVILTRYPYLGILSISKIGLHSATRHAILCGAVFLFF
jgi:hypothetical protein